MRWLGLQGIYVLVLAFVLAVLANGIDGFASTRVDGGLLEAPMYNMLSQSIVYCFGIISITLMSLMLVEIAFRKSINYLQYALIALSLTLFYLLLLSMSEHVSFGIAYLIAAAMTVLLITGYMWKMLGSRKVAIIIGLILMGMYGSCYIMLTLSTYALLLGSLILFVALAAVMYGSLKLQKNH